MGMNKNASFAHVAHLIMVAMAAIVFAGAADAADEVSPAEDVANWSDAEEFVADTLGKMKLGQDIDPATLDRLVDICESALDSSPEDARAYPLFLKAARGLIDYSPDDIEGRLGVYYAQSELVKKILGRQYIIHGMSGQDVLRANALLKDFMANIVSRIIPDYKPRPFILDSTLKLPDSAYEPIVVSSEVFSDYMSKGQIPYNVEIDETENANNALLNNEQHRLNIMRQSYESMIADFVKDAEGTGPREHGEPRNETEGTGSHGAGGPRKSFEEEK